jgi:protease II
MDYKKTAVKSYRRTELRNEKRVLQKAALVKTTLLKEMEKSLEDETVSVFLKQNNYNFKIIFYHDKGETGLSPSFLMTFFLFLSACPGHVF